MRTIQGKTLETKLAHVFRQIRKDYVDNQRKGIHPKDTGQLAELDNFLEELNASRRVSAKR